ncbi:hypothetical protein [Alloalcanivorax xenomutans]|uniref:Uncharacterized protein n=1 Tax=Alloalcanivorax xenomutans TaxID=1094342 RepID=A0A9Q3W6U5_9GAMM|nr:hypothetical protein [Alloalcanivorax xenomutans]MCE7510281.1 hypothetical protein [Alloalcanivorax xenomutans]
MTTRNPMRRQGNDMDLPAGKTCADCVHCQRCCSIFGHIPEDETCDWSPSRFQLVTVAPGNPLCASPLTEREAQELEGQLSDLARFLGAPGDWGYGTKLGRFTQEVHRLLVDIRRGVVVADDG